MPKSRMTITIDPAAHAAMSMRQENMSEAISVSLDRYLTLIARAQRALDKALSAEEKGLILDALNGVHLGGPHAAMFALVTIRDCLADGYDGKWGVDADALTEKLDEFTPLDQIALVDAAEIWWAAVARGEAPEPTSMFALALPQRQSMMRPE